MLLGNALLGYRLSFQLYNSIVISNDAHCTLICPTSFTNIEIQRCFVAVTFKFKQVLLCGVCVLLILRAKRAEIFEIY